MRDIWRYVFAFWAVIVTQWLFSKLVGRPPDEWDHTHALIMAGVYVIVKAIRSDKTVVRVIGNAEPGNWEATIVKGADHDRD
jgi:hypothetical protein